MSAGIIILLAYAIVAVLLVTRKMPTVIALILLAAIFTLACGAGFKGEYGLLTYVIPTGASYMGSTMILVVLACWLGKLMEHTGITYTIIKKAAEFGGDRPFVTSLILCVVSSVLFCVMYGTGPVIMVGTIVIPLLLTCGLAPLNVGAVFMFAYGVGIFLNPAWVGVYTALTGADVADTRISSLILAAAALVLMVLYLAFCFRRKGKKYAFAAPAGETENADADSKKILGGFRGFLACMTPLVIIIGTFAFSLDANVVFLAGIIWITIWTIDIKCVLRYLNLIAQSLQEGWIMAAPTAILLIAIGMLLQAIGIPAVTEVLTPVVDFIIPKTIVGLIAFLIVLGPLALYRGIFNPWGMGAGLVSIMCLMPNFSAPVLTLFFMAGARWSNIHDPTSSQCIWSSNYAGTEITQVMKHTFIWDEVFVITAALIALPVVNGMYPL